MREELQFFGPETKKMFGCTYMPPGNVIGGVVICPSIHAELLANYRKEVLLARKLAAAGFAVQRFHYRGMGNSDGDSSEVTFETLRDDAIAAGQQLLERGVQSLGYMGTRVGGLIAASALSARKGAPLATWDPTLKAEDFFREVMRARLIRGVKQGRPAAETRHVSLKDLDKSGFIDVLGYPIHRSLHDSFAGRVFEDELGAEPRPVLIVQFSHKDSIKPSYSNLRGRLNERGFNVDITTIAGRPAWWFVGERLRAEGDLNATSGWLVDRFGEMA